MIGWVQFRRRGWYCRRIQYIFVFVIKKHGKLLKFDIGFSSLNHFSKKYSDCLVKIEGVMICSQNDVENFMKVIDEDLSVNMIEELELKFGVDCSSLKNYNGL